MKEKIIKRHTWDLNICCGKTDGGGINVDIVKHGELPNFIRVLDVYKLPFLEREFDTVLSSHTIEHVDDPQAFFSELARVGKEVSLILPPLWDLTAAFNIFEHKWIFLTFKKEHRILPRYVKLPLARFLHEQMGQKIKA